MSEVAEMKKVLKILVKIFLPLILAVTVTKWIGILLTSLSTVVLYILAILFLICGVLTYLMGISTGQSALTLVVCGCVSFIILQILKLCLAGMEVLNVRMRRFLRP